jgi:hypothetical protein
MTRIGPLGVVGLIVIVLALVLWIVMTIQAQRNPTLPKVHDEQPPRGPVSGGVMRGDPGQVIPTGDAPRQDEEAREAEEPPEGEGGRNGPLDR